MPAKLARTRLQSIIIPPEVKEAYFQAIVDNDGQQISRLFKEYPSIIIEKNAHGQTGLICATALRKKEVFTIILKKDRHPHFFSELHGSAFVLAEEIAKDDKNPEPFFLDALNEKINAEKKRQLSRASRITEKTGAPAPKKTKPSAPGPLSRLVTAITACL
jgi:hypothetical protein